MKINTFIDELVKSVKHASGVQSDQGSPFIKNAVNNVISMFNTSIRHLYVENKENIEQECTLAFLKVEVARLWDVRQSIIAERQVETREVNALARQGYVSDSQKLEDEIHAKYDDKLRIINEKIKGLRVAIDHTLHAGGDDFSTRAYAPVMTRENYVNGYPRDYDLEIKHYVQARK